MINKLLITIVCILSLYLIHKVFYNTAKIEHNSNIKFISITGDKVEIEKNGITKYLTAKCPHAGCIVKYDPNTRQLICPCHDSKFDLDGNLLQGPATTGLIEIEDLGKAITT